MNERFNFAASAPLLLLTLLACGTTVTAVAGPSGSSTGASSSTGKASGNGGAHATGVGGGASMICPTSSPASGSSCPMSGIRCQYDQTSCACTAGAWSCETCPGSPTPGAACVAAPGQVCSDADSLCTCVHAAGGTAGTWECLECPTNEPANASSCASTDYGLACWYGTASCTCLPNGWVCQDACPPASSPPTGLSCKLPSGLACDYGSVTCLCVNGAFACN